MASSIQDLGSSDRSSIPGAAVEVLSSIGVNGVRPGNTEFTIDGTPAIGSLDPYSLDGLMWCMSVAASDDRQNSASPPEEGPARLSKAG